MHDDIFIRKAGWHDIGEVFDLSNQDYVRKYSINKEKISWEKHVEWFNNTIQDVNKVFYVITDSKEKFLGEIRFDINKDFAVVSISLSKTILGKGYSLKLLQEGINRLFDSKKDVDKIIAYVSEKNIASDRLFRKAGFFLVEEKEGLLKYAYQKGTC